MKGGSNFANIYIWVPDRLSKLVVAFVIKIRVGRFGNCAIPGRCSDFGHLLDSLHRFLGSSILLSNQQQELFPRSEPDSLVRIATR
jgi:hypothetical protein